MQDFFVPFSFMYIKEHRSGCIGVIGDMCLSACQFPDQPCIYSSKQQFAIFCTFSALFDMIKDPGKFGRRKVSIWDQSCFFVDFFTKSVFYQFLHFFCSPAALPDDRIVYRLSGCLLPDNRCLSLIGNADCRNVLFRYTDLAHRLGCYRNLRRPYFHRIMFDPSRFWENLLKFHLCHTADVSLPVK